MVVMAFAATNLLAYKVWYEPTMKKTTSERKAAERQAAFNAAEAGSAEAIAADRQWLERNEPEPTSVGRMKTKIQQLAENEALRNGLVIKRKTFGDEVIEPNFNYHRARFQIEVNGIESSIYRWLDRLHQPSDFRVVTYMRVNPQRDDDTRADCEVYLDQWFVPEGGEE